jgi:hypothetical protein
MKSLIALIYISYITCRSLKGDKIKLNGKKIIFDDMAILDQSSYLSKFSLEYDNKLEKYILSFETKDNSVTGLIRAFCSIKEHRCLRTSEISLKFISLTFTSQQVRLEIHHPLKLHSLIFYKDLPKPITKNKILNKLAIFKLHELVSRLNFVHSELHKYANINENHNNLRLDILNTDPNKKAIEYYRAFVIDFDRAGELVKSGFEKDNDGIIETHISKPIQLLVAYLENCKTELVEQKNGIIKAVLEFNGIESISKLADKEIKDVITVFDSSL